MIDREPLSSDLGDVREGQEQPARKTITLHDRDFAATKSVRGFATAKSVALLPPPVVIPAPPVPLPRTEVQAPRRGTPQTLGVFALFGGLAAMIVTAFGVTGVLMLIGLCVALRLMWTDRAGR